MPRAPRKATYADRESSSVAHDTLVFRNDLFLLQAHCIKSYHGELSPFISTNLWMEVRVLVASRPSPTDWPLGTVVSPRRDDTEGGEAHKTVQDLHREAYPLSG